MKNHQFVLAPKISKGRKSKQMKAFRKGARKPGTNSQGSRRRPF